MAAKKYVIYPIERRKLVDLGDRLKRARLRRKLSMQVVADRCNISRSTLYKLEKGHHSCSIGLLIKVLSIYRLLDDIELVAKDDILGRTLLELGLRSYTKANEKE